MYSKKDNHAGSILIIVILLILMTSIVFIWLYFSPTVPTQTNNKTIHFSEGVGTSNYNISYQIFENQDELKINNTVDIVSDSHTFEELNCGDILIIEINSYKYPFPSRMVFTTSFTFEYRCNEQDELIRIR